MHLKRWLAVLICLALLPGVLPEVRAAQVYGDFEYTVNDGSVTITGCRDKEITALVIPAAINGNPVTELGRKSFWDCNAISSIRLPEGLQRIGEQAFCTDRLKELVIPASVQAFSSEQQLPNLERVYNYSRTANRWRPHCAARIYMYQGDEPMELSRVGNYCPFEEIGFDPRTQTLYTEGRMTYALVDGEAILLEADPVWSFTVPDTLGGCPVTRIAPFCFLGAAFLKNLTLPDSVRMIGRGAVQIGPSIDSKNDPVFVTGLPAALEYVGEYAFINQDLHTVTALPSGLTHVGAFAFGSCQIETLTVPGSLKALHTGVLFNNPFRDLVLEEGVEVLEINAISVTTGRIVLPGSIRSVSQFWTPVKPDGLDIYCAADGPVGDLLRLYEVPFYDLDTGEYYALPYNVTQGGVRYRVYPGRYAMVLGLELGAPAELVIPAEVEGVPVEEVFEGALSSETLLSIELPDTVRRIDRLAMTNSTNLQYLRLPEGLTVFDSMSILNCTQLHVLRIPASVTEIRDNYLKFDRILLVEAGSYAEEYARTHECAFVRMEEGTQYVGMGRALCRVEPEGAVLVGLVSGEDVNGTPCYEVPDTVGELPVVGIDAGCVFGGSAVNMQIFDTRIDLLLGSHVEWIAPGALDGTGIRGLYTYPALRELPEDLFADAGDRPVEIGGFFGSYAQTYAQAHGIPFVILDGTPFTDVPRESWYFEPVFRCYWSGLMNGTSDTTFSPNANASRAMLVTVLWRMCDAPMPAGAYFADVPSDSWYCGAVNWAAENGVVFGTGPYRFSPDQNVTREQTAAILFRLASAMGLPADSFAPLGGFRDADSASDYARSALMWAVDAGILQGNDRHELRPQGTATRAELAAMLIRFVAWYEKEMAA